MPFPTRQHVDQQRTFALTVRNAGEEAISGLAVTLRGFSERSAPDSQRPIVRVDGRPAFARVDPRTGRVVRE